MKRKLSLLIAVCALVYVAASSWFLLYFSGAETPQAPESTLTIWSSDNMAEDAFAQYQLSHPDVALNYVHVDRAEYLYKLKITIALGEELPDLCVVDNASFGEVMALGVLEDLEQPPYSLNREELIDASVPPVCDDAGRVCGVPAFLPISGMAYDRAIALEFLGTDDPEKVSVAFNSWADILSRGTEFQERMPDQKFFASLEDPAVMLFGQSAEPYVVDGVLTGEYRFLSYFKILAALRDAGLSGSAAQNSPQWYASFEAGETFFYPCSLSMIDSGVFHTDSAWGFTLPPSGGFRYGGETWAICADSDQKELAWDFIQTVLLSPAGAVYNKNKANGNFICYEPAYSLEGYQDLVVEDFGGQNIGRTYFETVLPSVALWDGGELAATVEDVYLQVVRAMMFDAQLDAQGAYDLFLARLAEQAPSVQLEEEVR